VDVVAEVWQISHTHWHVRREKADPSDNIIIIIIP
jgi:hypothetical protein